MTMWPCGTRLDQCCAYALVETGVFGRPLATLAGLVLVRQVMQKTVRIVGFDGELGRIRGVQIHAIDPGFMMIDRHQEFRCADWAA